MSRRQTLPDRVALGRGYVVRVVELAPVELKAKLEAYEGRPKRKKRAQIKSTAGRPAGGFWDDEALVIYVDSTISARRRRRVYWHEMVHAVHDIAVMDEGGI